MPYIPNTPESKFQRTDSKNPATTCQGLTNDGKRCRRLVSKLPQTSVSSNSVQNSNVEGKGYCWQHRDQASTQPGQASSGIHRSSLDTLVDRLGILDVKPSKNEHKSRPSMKTRASSNGTNAGTQRLHSSGRHPQKQSSLFALCCMSTADEQKRPPRPIKHYRPPPTSTVLESASNRPGDVYSNHSIPRPAKSVHDITLTKELLSLIPPSASPKTASQLLAELAKPPSEKDSEGFIYMFWLTPESWSDQPSAQTTSMLLASPSKSNPETQHPSDFLDKFTNSRSINGNKKILLKIGRAQNVHRRLNQWTRQCGYNLSLIRYYPYHSTNTSSKGFEESEVPIKVPHVNKVERLIHIEISSKRVHHERCEACGKEHKEWFEVDASREGVREIDKVIRHWADWNVRAGKN